MIRRLAATFIQLAFMLQISPLSAQKTINYKIDKGKSTINWRAAKVTGSHQGLISVSNGYFMIDNNMVVGGTVYINMKSIRNLDIKDSESKLKLENHLKSEDFFDVNNFPEAVFKIYQVNEVESSKEEKYTHIVNGSLTIKGYTEKLTFPVAIDIKNEKVSMQGSVTIDRTAFNIKYGSGKFYEDLGDQLIYDDFDIEFNVNGVAKED